MDLEPVLRRIDRWMILAGAAGAVAALILWGWRGAVAFLLGAAASYWNYRWLKRIVDLLGGGAVRPPLRSILLFGARYLLLGIGAYVIVKYSTLSLAAALCGLFVPVAAIIVEILFELFYAS